MKIKICLLFFIMFQGMLLAQTVRPSVLLCLVKAEPEVGKILLEKSPVVLVSEDEINSLEYIKNGAEVELFQDGGRWSEIRRSQKSD